MASTSPVKEDYSIFKPPFQKILKSAFSYIKIPGIFYPVSHFTTSPNTRS